MGLTADQTNEHLTRPCLSEPGPQVVSGPCGDGSPLTVCWDARPGPQPHIRPSFHTGSPCPSWQRSGPPSSQGCSPPLGAPRCSPAGTDAVGAGLWGWATYLPPRPGLLPDEDGPSHSLPAPPPSLPSALECPTHARSPTITSLHLPPKKEMSRVTLGSDPRPANSCPGGRAAALGGSSRPRRVTKRPPPARRPAAPGSSPLTTIW